jgi:hypothetical protein
MTSTQPICPVCQRKLEWGSSISVTIGWIGCQDDLGAAGYPHLAEANYPHDAAGIFDGKPVTFVYADGDDIGSVSTAGPARGLRRVEPTALPDDGSRRSRPGPQSPDTLFIYRPQPSERRLVHPWKSSRLAGMTC